MVSGRAVWAGEVEQFTLRAQTELMTKEGLSFPQHHSAASGTEQPQRR